MSIFLFSEKQHNTSNYGLLHGICTHMIWCELESVTPDVAVRYGGAESVYRVIQKRRTDIQSRSYCIKIGREQLATGSGGFSNWILTDRSELAPLEIRRFSMRSSRS